MKKIWFTLICLAVVVLYASQATNVASPLAAKQECRHEHRIQVPSDYPDINTAGREILLPKSSLTAGFQIRSKRYMPLPPINCKEDQT